MSNSTVSVIIPVYNPGAYLHRCLESVTGQTFKDIEIICVDDGSTDGSGKICDEYAKKDSRVKVIHKENGGASSARNAGLKAAGGGYIAFIDSDDYIEPDYIQTLYQNMDGVDAAACGSHRVTDDMETERSIPKKNALYSTNEQIRKSYQSKGDIFTYFKGPVGKLYRSSAIGGIRFDESLKIAEDIIFNLHFLRNAGAIRTVSYCGYSYYQKTDSLTHNNSLRYNASLERDRAHYRKIKDAAMRAWGFDDEILNEAAKRTNAHDYFAIISNLMLPGTPYSKKQIREKIRKIHADKEFVQSIRDVSYSSLSLMCKISKFSVQLNMPQVTMIIISYAGRTMRGTTKTAKLIGRIRRKRYESKGREPQISFGDGAADREVLSNEVQALK